MQVYKGARPQEVLGHQGVRIQGMQGYIGCEGEREQGVRVQRCEV